TDHRRAEMKASFKTMVGIAGIVAVVGAGCSQSMAAHDGMAMASPSTTSSGTKAAALRTTLNNLFAEHVWLAGSATGAALGGRDADFKAAAAVLDQNSVAIARAIGSVYGSDAEQAFLPLWRKHIGFAVDYTVGVATSDRVKADKAVNDLVAYSQDFGVFLQSAN